MTNINVIHYTYAYIINVKWILSTYHSVQVKKKESSVAVTCIEPNWEPLEPLNKYKHDIVYIKKWQRKLKSHNIQAFYLIKMFIWIYKIYLNFIETSFGKGFSNTMKY